MVYPKTPREVFSDFPPVTLCEQLIKVSGDRDVRSINQLKGKYIMAKGKSGGVTPMTKAAAARIYSATAKAGNGTIPKGSFPARAESAAAKAAPIAGKKP